MIKSFLSGYCTCIFALSLVIENNHESSLHIMLVFHNTSDIEGLDQVSPWRPHLSYLTNCVRFSVSFAKLHCSGTITDFLLV